MIFSADAEGLNGSALAGPVATPGEGWTYDDGVFTVTGENTNASTAVWTVSQGGYKATVTLTLTGTNGEATYNAGIVVSEVSAMD